MPTRSKAIWNKKSIKLPLNLFCVSHLLLAVGLSLSAVNEASETPLEKTNLSFESGCQLQRVSWLGVGAHIHSPVSTQDSSVLYLCRPCAAATDSVSSFVYQPCSVSKTLSPWSHQVKIFLMTVNIGMLKKKGKVGKRMRKRSKYAKEK